MRIAPWRENETNLRSDVIVGLFAVGNGHGVVVNRVMEAVVSQTGRELELVPGLPLVVNIKTDSIEIGFDVLVRDRAGDAVDFGVRVRSASLVTRAGDKRVTAEFVNLLKFGGVSLEFAAICYVESGRVHDEVRVAADNAVANKQKAWIGVGQFECVIEAASERERVNAGPPFAVIAEEEVGFLPFFDAQRAAR